MSKKSQSECGGYRHVYLPSGCSLHQDPCGRIQRQQPTRWHHGHAYSGALSAGPSLELFEAAWAEAEWCKPLPASLSEVADRYHVQPAIDGKGPPSALLTDAGVPSINSQVELLTLKK